MKLRNIFARLMVRLRGRTITDELELYRAMRRHPAGSGL